MSVFKRAFTKREKILLIAFAIILIGLLYFRFVDVEVRNGMEAANTAIETNRSELEISNAMLANLQNMDKELSAYEAGGTTVLASYNNIQEEVAFLDSVLASADTYSIDIRDPQLSGDLVRRDISVSFTAGNFEKAYNIINDFSTSTLRNVIKDISYSRTNRNRDGEAVNVTMTVTFYETMVGGTPDAGLPAPSE